MSRPTAAILLTGSELLRGVISDLNAAHLARRLEAIGFDMQRTLLVGDPIEQIEQGVRELTGSHDLVVTSGGLGPTHDDRTVEALANVAGRPLEVDEGVLAQITSWTDGVADRMGFPRGRFEAGNRKQARIPQGASVLGLAGTAPGLVMEVDGSVVVVLPGVPSELRRLWEMAPAHAGLAALMARADPRERWLIRTYGIGESHVADLFAEAGGDADGVETRSAPGTTRSRSTSARSRRRCSKPMRCGRRCAGRWASSPSQRTSGRWPRSSSIRPGRSR